MKLKNFPEANRARVELDTGDCLLVANEFEEKKLLMYSTDEEEYGLIDLSNGYMLLESQFDLPIELFEVTIGSIITLYDATYTVYKVIKNNELTILYEGK